MCVCAFACVCVCIRDSIQFWDFDFVFYILLRRLGIDGGQCVCVCGWVSDVHVSIDRTIQNVNIVVNKMRSPEIINIGSGNVDIISIPY